MEAKMSELSVHPTAHQRRRSSRKSLGNILNNINLKGSNIAVNDNNDNRQVQPVSRSVRLLAFN